MKDIGFNIESKIVSGIEPNIMSNIRSLIVSNTNENIQDNVNVIICAGILHYIVVDVMNNIDNNTAL